MKRHNSLAAGKSIWRLLPAVALAGLLVFSATACNQQKNDQRSSPPTTVGASQPVVASSLPYPTLVHLATLTDPAMTTPLRIAIEPNGVVLVTSPRSETIHFFAPDGQPITYLTSVRTPLGIAIAANGDILVGDEFNKRVVHLSPMGNFLENFCPDSYPINKPNDIAVHSVTGEVWIVDSSGNRVVRCSEKGEFLGEIGTLGNGPGQLHFPTSVTIDEDADEVIVSDFSNGRLEVFDTADNFLRQIGTAGGGDGKLARPQGLVLDSLKRLYVAEGYQSQLEIFDMAGGFVGWYGVPGDQPGQMLLPFDVAIDSYNRLYVTSYQTGRVEVFGLDSYSEPLPEPAGLGALTAVFPPAIDLSETSVPIYLKLCLDVPGSVYPIVLSSVRIAGVIPLDATDPIHEGVACGTNDYKYEVMVRFQKKYLVKVLPPEATSEVTVTGTLLNGKSFIGSFPVTLTNSVNAAARSLLLAEENQAGGCVLAQGAQGRVPWELLFPLLVIGLVRWRRSVQRRSVP